ncbi:nuclear transport factor 2 family protein [Thalassotalea fonticola]|uniref:Nuclear transport factor 2 family protein n=1 Tax=Thalassotalea fonticola TaxID=3065649 RepID=A0ABZ0GTM2_9GAMM|nr:nuclear transport factor 2 family protein [Colwelliaceae bacterium S1-1]
MTFIIRALLFVFCLTTSAFANENTLAELDSAWAEMERAVMAGDFDAYQAAYHDDAVLVSGFSNTSYPIATAMKRWQQGFDDTKAGKVTVALQFKLSKRFHDDTTAHETGMFRYATTDENGKEDVFIAHMSALLVKKSGKWLMMMEYQKSKATEAQWLALK